MKGCGTGNYHPPADVRFWRQVDKSAGLGPRGDCWEWRGHTVTNGYGVISIKSKNTLTHRFAWILANGDIPAGEGHHGTCVCHRCDNRICVNPAHLFLGTHDVNMKDAAAKGRVAGRIGQTAHRAKLTDDEVREIRTDRRLLREIAEDFGVSQTTISGIRRRTLWVHLT